MKTSARVLALALSGLLLVALASPGSSQASARASLSVSPSSHYIGGQALTFSGHIGKSGRNRIILQSHMNRHGDEWEPLPGFSAYTKATGAFEFQFRAPAMKGISYRVKSGSATTPKVTFQALSQDVTLAVSGDAPVAGQPFTIEADTTPTLRRRPDTIGLKPIPGRALTLQRRIDGDSWQQVAQTTVRSDGMGYFEGVREPQAGTVVYRVRMENWFQGANQIGWFPSFPTYVDIAGSGQPRTAASVGRTAASADCVQPVVGDVATATAAGTNKWGASLFDFAWVAGESLTSPPYKGTRKRGRWVDYTDGGGRVNKHNGGLMLDSKRENDCGPGDFGTTRATLKGNALTYGRWEVRLRLKSDEASRRDYRTLVELIPQRSRDYTCGAHNVTIAEMLPHSSTVKYGVKAGTKQWNGSKGIGDQVNDRSLVFAVEVTRTHMSWFYAGRVIGTVRSRAASSDVPMTLRLSMVGGEGSEEMNHTELISDWQRAFTLKRGNKVASGKALKRSGHTPSC